MCMYIYIYTYIYIYIHGPSEVLCLQDIEGDEEESKWEA